MEMIIKLAKQKIPALDDMIKIKNIKLFGVRRDYLFCITFKATSPQLFDNKMNLFQRPKLLKLSRVLSGESPRTHQEKQVQQSIVTEQLAPFVIVLYLDCGFFHLDFVFSGIKYVWFP